MNATIVSVTRSSGVAHCSLVPWSVPPVALPPSVTVTAALEPYLNPSDSTDVAIQVGRPKRGKLQFKSRSYSPDNDRHHVSLRDHRGGRSKGFRNQEVW